MAIDASVQSPSQRRPTSHTIKGWARSVLIHMLMALIPAARDLPAAVPVDVDPH